MRNIQKMTKRCLAWLLCMAVTIGCFPGLNRTAWAAEEEASYEVIKAWTFDSDVERFVTIAFGYAQPVLKSSGIGLVHISDERIGHPAFTSLAFGGNV